MPNLTNFNEKMDSPIYKWKYYFIDSMVNMPKLNWLFLNCVKNNQVVDDGRKLRRVKK